MVVSLRLGLITCTTLIGVVLPWTNEALSLERAALMLSGSGCRMSQQAIVEALERLEGVVQVKADVIPDHLMIDHDGSHYTGEELAGLLNELATPDGPCRAAIMKSCITAGPGTATAASTSTRNPDQ